MGMGGVWRHTRSMVWHSSCAPVCSKGCMHPPMPEEVRGARLCEGLCVGKRLRHQPVEGHSPLRQLWLSRLQGGRGMLRSKKAHLHCATGRLPGVRSWRRLALDRPPRMGKGGPPGTTRGECPKEVFYCGHAGEGCLGTGGGLLGGRVPAEGTWGAPSVALMLCSSTGCMDTGCVKSSGPQAVPASR